MKIVQAFGSPFTHDKSSCMGSVPTNHVWHYGACEDSDIEVYLDYDVAGGFKSPCENKFLWLSESKSIVPHQYAFVKMHYEKFCDCYKAIFTADRELVALHDKFIESPGGSNYTWVTPDKRGVHEKSKLVSMISSGKVMCEDHVNRNAIADKMIEQGVDMFGRLYTPVETKDMALNDYMFSVTIENVILSNYQTEKVIDCFATGTVPIYLGNPSIGETFNPDGIIFYDDNFDLNMLSEDLYEKMLPAVKENYEIFCNMKISDDVIFDKITKLL